MAMGHFIFHTPAHQAPRFSQEATMPAKAKSPSIFDHLREALRRALEDLGPLLTPGRLAPSPVPVHPRPNLRRRRRV